MTRNRGKAVTGNGANTPHPSPAAAPQPPVAPQSRAAQPPTASQPPAASQPSAPSQSSAPSQPSAASQSTGGSQPFAASQSSASSQPAGGSQSSAASQSAGGSQPAGESQPHAASQPLAGAKAGGTPQSRAARRRSGRAKPASGPKAEGHTPAEPADQAEPASSAKASPAKASPATASPTTTSPTTPAPDSAPNRLADLALRILGLLVGMAGGLVTAVIEAFLTPLRIGTTRAPFSILLAVVGNVLLVWFTYRATSHKGAAVLPGLVWFAIMIIAAARTTEGDLLLTGNNWVGVATIFAGTIGFAGALYRLILPRRPAS